MSTSQTHQQQLDQAIDLLGDAYTLCIVHHLAQQDMRFCELQRAINQLNPSTLSNRLKKLEHSHIITRQTESDDKLAVVYQLTDKGQDVIPIIDQVAAFATKYY